MNIEQCYEAMHGDFAEVMGRLRAPDRIIKFVKRVPSDDNYEILCNAMQSDNVEEAFRAAHTIKGICLNLSLTALYKSSNALTEALRGKDGIGDDARKIFETLKNDYKITVDAIKALDA